VATKSQDLKAAEKKYPKAEIWVEVNRRAPTPAQREEWTERLKELRSRAKEIEPLTRGKHREKVAAELARGGQFLLDVGMAEAAMKVMREALAAYQTCQDAIDELIDNKKERQRLAPRTLCRRYSVWKSGSGFSALFKTRIASGDTWDEVLNQLKEAK